MPDQSASLGGRVPLFDPHALTAAQKAVYDSMVKDMVPWAKAAGFTAMLEDGRLVGPFNTILESPGIAAAFLALQAAEQKHTTLSKRLRQVVILTLGRCLELRLRTLRPRSSGARSGSAGGGNSGACSGRAGNRPAAEELLAQASAAFGAQGIVDLIFLAGCYQTISSLLNAFKVPVPR